MAAEREREIERICQAALERPRTERETFVAEACGGDDDLRQEVERLLAYEDAASAFLETPALAVAAEGMGSGSQALSTGQKLGAYTILSPLGSGGMGEVYRARDATLGREVAIKVLPTIFTADPERLARFEREARVLASLNHPNIATIHGVEHVDGLHALILEVVEGQTLEARIRTGGPKRPPLPLPEALAIARQIAEALEAAHEKGIVHRDLKPANIKVRPDGVVKVLDFGLAKAVGSDAPGADLSHTPTVTVGRTGKGVLLGTAAYMSPEQARGKPVDKRADIWAFGCVLYEMLTGRAPFAGDTVSDTIAATLEREPNWQALPPATPEKVQGLLRRCLQKDPQHRLRDIGDARLDIDDAIAAPSTAGAGAAAGRRVAGSAVLAAVVGVVALLLFLILMRPQPAVPAADLTLTIVPPAASGIARVSSGAGLAIPKISPDGSFVAYFDRSSTLQLRRLNSTSPEPLRGVDGAWFVWSPDSKFLIFVDRNTLKRIRVPDGAPETIGVAPPNAILNGTTKSGASIFMRPDFTLLLAPHAGAEASEVRVPGLKDGALGSVRALPGGDDFLFRFVPQGSEQSEIYLVTVRNGNLSDPVLLMSNAVAPSYTPAGGGRILFIRNDNLYAQRLNRRTRRLEGDPELVQRGVASGAEFLAAFSVSDSGIVAWRPGRAAFAQVTIFDRQGTPIGTAGPFSNTGALKLSSDEQHVLLAERTGRAWLLEPNQAGRLDVGQGHLSMLWSPDASGFLVPQGSRVVARPVTGSIEGRELVRVPDLVRLEDVSADGRLVLFRKSSWSDLFSVRLDGRPEDRVPKTVQTGKLISNVRLSPDERWIVYQGDGPGEEVGVYVQPFPGPALPKQIASSGESPVWGKDGKEILYLDQDRIWSVPTDTSGGQLRAGTATAMFSVRSMEGGRRVRGISQLAVSRDGLRIYYQQPVEQPDSDVIHIKMGWAR